jgi:phytoene dehydrogenase-like protein
MTKVVLLTLEAVGAPIVEGGSDNIVAAFKQLIEAHGGTLLPGVDVARVIVERGRAQVWCECRPKWVHLSSSVIYCVIADFPRCGFEAQARFQLTGMF